LKAFISIFLVSLFFFSCKTTQSAKIITSKKVAQEKGVYTSYTEKKELVKPTKPTKQELKAIEKAKTKAKLDSIEAAKYRTIVDEDTPQDFTPTFEVNDYVKSQILNVARESLGSPYRSGGTSPSGFDCSGFVIYTLEQFDIKLPRTSQEMARTGKRIKRADAKPGDLIFFNTTGGGVSHVGIVTEVLENEIKFIHSSSSSGVMYSTTAENYYARTFIGVNRILE
jgi:murein DD-endopeptidase / murein LD-carboxypeptidase